MYHLALIGDGGVGKSTLALALLGKGPVKRYIPTKGPAKWKLKINGKHIILWEIPEEDEKNKIKQCCGCIIVCSSTDKRSAEPYMKWSQERNPEAGYMILYGDKPLTEGRVSQIEEWILKLIEL